MARIATLFQRLGPYHHARLKALALQSDSLGIEFTGVDDTYAWDRIIEAQGFKKITVFPDKNINKQPVSAVVSRITSILDSFRPEVVAIPGWSSRCSLIALSWCIKTGTAAIVMSESTLIDEPRKWWKETIKRRIIRFFSAGLVGGKRHKYYLARLGLPIERILPGYDVVDNSFFSTEAEIARQNDCALRERLGLPLHYFLASNRFIEKKNLFRVLQAYAEYCNQAGNEWKLVVLGDGPLKSELLKLADDLHIFDKVLFPGFKQYDELPAYYGLAGAFVHASTSEQWGLVVNEAMASGLPVIVSERCGCAPDLVEEGRNGFIFDPFDVKVLARLMRKVASDECDRKTMGRASREIISGWTPKFFAENFLKATQIALQVPPRKAGLLDKALLWGSIYR